MSGLVEDLDQRAQSHESAREAIATSEEALQGIEKDIQRWEGEHTKLFDRAGLGVDEEATLREWVRMHPEYLTAAEDVRHAKRDREAAEVALVERAGLIEMPKDELVETRRLSQDLADKLEALNLRIGGLETEISNAKRASDLEAALAQKAECADALRRQRDVDYDLVAGHVLADFLARRERDRERPAVFKRAQKLFVDITHGHFRLDIDESDPPAFRAVDTRQQRGLALDELSSGTRLQLLLAVKLAFIERQEQGPKLPLILDETLANSDERPGPRNHRRRHRGLPRRSTGILLDGAVRRSRKVDTDIGRSRLRTKQACQPCGASQPGRCGAHLAGRHYPSAGP